MTLGFKAQVRDGRLVIDEAVDWPEGTEVELMPIDHGDDLDDEDRARLNAALEESAAEFRAGLGIPAEEVLAELDAYLRR